MKRYFTIHLLVVLTCIIALADERMWIFVHSPSKKLKELYVFTPEKEWLDHVRLASIRFNNGGSGSFVSPHGLVMTNHHVAIGQVQKISTEKNDYVTNGFFARSKADEYKCPDLELNVLFAMEEVTKQVRSVLKKNMDDVTALKARKAEIARIEKESLDKTGLRSNVIDLYHGGEYWLYRYKRYTDVRLVFAPERQAAYFGGDADNFTFPRYDLDVAFFRVYEDRKPIKSDNYFTWNSKGATEEELVFVTGNPGTTDRLLTYNQLLFYRNLLYPLLLKDTKDRIGIVREYMKRGEEETRRGLVRVFSLENRKKALTGRLNGLLDKNLMAKRKKEEKKLRSRIKKDKELENNYGSAWETIDGVLKKQKTVTRERYYSHIRGSSMVGFALTIVRYVTEVTKPDAERLDGYHDSELEEQQFHLFSPAPIYRDREEAFLAGNLAISQKELGDDHELVRIVLKGKTPQETAKKLITDTKLDKVELRKKLIDGSEKAVKHSKDPLIKFARKLDTYLRKIEKWDRENIESIVTPAEESIAKARFAVYGKGVYPDATFTLRLAYGVVKGFPMNGTKSPYKTTLYGLYDRALSFDQKEDFWLPQRFWDRKDSLDLATPVNCVNTTDIIGGNSGSPVINKKAELVGLIFDGNIESLAGRFIYDDAINRAVAVHSAYIIEALRKLYDCGYLADEIEGK